MPKEVYFGIRWEDKLCEEASCVWYNPTQKNNKTRLRVFPTPASLSNWGSTADNGLRRRNGKEAEGFSLIWSNGPVLFWCSKSSPLSFLQSKYSISDSLVPLLQGAAALVGPLGSWFAVTGGEPGDAQNQGFTTPGLEFGTGPSELSTEALMIWASPTPPQRRGKKNPNKLNLGYYCIISIQSPRESFFN